MTLTTQKYPNSYNKKTLIRYNDAMNNFVEVKNLQKQFESKKGFWGEKKEIVYAINGLNFSINKGETFALVGESGCGKSTAARCILALEKITSGDVIFDGINMRTADKKTLRDLRKKIQIIFQNPYSSLNPRMKIYDILAEPLKINFKLSKEEIEKRILETADMTGISRDSLFRFPHEFSGGQRQRIGIARAIILKPEFIIADEPVSALDVSIQAQILNLLKDLKQELNLTYLFISHDLSVVEYIADKIGVMYLGELVETATTKELFSDPKHPYTKALLGAVPKIQQDPTTKILLSGDLPSPKNLPKGCKFSSRCPYVMDICHSVNPEYTVFSETQKAKCHLYSK
jgi:peptide/nickel transport system ATP-binding protein/oligopeptide transport system ATP-binding protein